MTLYFSEVSAATNCQPENIMRNAIFRMAIREKVNNKCKITAEFMNAQRRVDKTAMSLSTRNLTESSPASRSIVTRRIIEQNKVHHTCGKETNQWCYNRDV